MTLLAQQDWQGTAISQLREPIRGPSRGSSFVLPLSKTLANTEDSASTGAQEAAATPPRPRGREEAAPRAVPGHAGPCARPRRHREKLPPGAVPGSRAGAVEESHSPHSNTCVGREPTLVCSHEHTDEVWVATAHRWTESRDDETTPQPARSIEGLRTEEGQPLHRVQQHAARQPRGTCGLIPSMAPGTAATSTSQFTGTAVGPCTPWTDTLYKCSRNSRPLLLVVPILALLVAVGPLLLGGRSGL